MKKLRKGNKEFEKTDIAKNKIDEFFKNNDIITSYLLQIDDIIVNNWDHLTNGIIFKNIWKKRQRYAIYLLAEYYHLIVKPNVIQTRRYMNHKLINNCPKGFEITYHSLTCQDCPELRHNGKYDCNCSQCSYLYDHMTVNIKFVDITIRRLIDNQIPHQTLAEKYQHKTYEDNSPRYEFV